MSDNLRMVTYNVQCRSWAMEAMADVSIPPSETCEERAKLISANLLDSARDYDVVCLNEVFDEDARDVFIAELLGRWPFAITKADFLNVEVAWPGKPILPINPAAFLLNTSGIGLLGSWIALGNPKLEDSGVMLFSRFPFALKPLDEQIATALTPFTLGQLTPLGFPQVGFLPYDDSTDNDVWAAKGMVYAQIERPGGDTYHVFASHTQADSEHVSEHQTERGAQFADTAEYIEELTEASTTAAHVFALGDFNVCGGQAAEPVVDVTKEWSELFATGTDLWSKHLVDVWGREQCVGGTAGGLRDRGATAQVVYDPPDQRLDYLFRNAASSLIAQHVYIDHALATVPPGVAGVSYLSDHRPLGCDLHRDLGDNAPNTAQVAVADPLFQDDNKLIPGQVRWYRFDRNGTYEFRLLSNQPVMYEVYLDHDLSLPRQPYRDQVSRKGTKFVLPSAPFLVKVFCSLRDHEANYRFRAVRHLGSSPWDAIDLVPEIDYHEAFPAGQLMNTDQALAPGDDTDSKWFITETPRIQVAEAIELTVDVTLAEFAEDGAMLSVWRDPGGGAMLVAEGQAGPDVQGLSVSWKARDNERFYVTVQRKNTGGNPLSFVIRLSTTVTMLLGSTAGQPRLVCTTETSGWGSDDIAMELHADGALLRKISNDEIGDFDEEDVRDLDQWIEPLVVYAKELEAVVIEEDDIDSNDVGRRTIGVLPRGQVAVGSTLSPGARVADVRPDGSVRVVATIDVDDGHYEFRHTLVRWHEQA